MTHTCTWMKCMELIQCRKFEFCPLDFSRIEEIELTILLLTVQCTVYILYSDSMKLLARLAKCKVQQINVTDSHLHTVECQALSAKLSCKRGYQNNFQARPRVLESHSVLLIISGDSYQSRRMLWLLLDGQRHNINFGYLGQEYTKWGIGCCEANGDSSERGGGIGGPRRKEGGGGLLKRVGSYELLGGRLTNCSHFLGHCYSCRISSAPTKLTTQICYGMLEFSHLTSGCFC